MSLRYWLATLAVLACTIPALVYAASTILNFSVAPPPAQTIASSSISCGGSCSFAVGSTQTIGTVSVVMNPASPAFNGSFALVASGGSCSGGNTSAFAITSNTGVLSNTSTSTGAGNYTACVQISESGISNSPQYLAVPITGSTVVTGAVASIQAPNTETVTTSQGTWSFGSPYSAGCADRQLLLNGTASGAYASAMFVLDGTLYAWEQLSCSFPFQWFVWNASNNSWGGYGNGQTPPTSTTTASVPIFLFLSPFDPNLQDTSASGTLVTSAAVQMSQGGTYTGAYSLSGDAIFTQSGATTNLARSLTSSDDGNHTGTITVAGGHTIRMNIAANVANPPTIACDIGPSYTGFIPHWAQVRGFTHCFANYDWSFTGSFTDSQGTHQWSNLSTWFDSSHATNGSPFLFNCAGQDPCDASHVNVVTDPTFGNQVLSLTHYGTDENNGTYYGYIETEANNTQNILGESYLTEMVYRFNPTTDPCNGSYCPLTELGTFGGATVNCFVNGCLEFDNTNSYEATVNSPYAAVGWNLNDGPTCTNGNGNGPNLPGNSFGFVSTPQTTFKAHSTQYDTADGILMNDGSARFGICAYWRPGDVKGLTSGDYRACGDDQVVPPATAPLFSRALFWGMQISSGHDQHSSPPSSPLVWTQASLFMKRTTIWTCTGSNVPPGFQAVCPGEYFGP